MGNQKTHAAIAAKRKDTNAGEPNAAVSSMHRRRCYQECENDDEPPMVSWKENKREKKEKTNIPLTTGAMYYRHEGVQGLWPRENETGS